MAITPDSGSVDKPNRSRGGKRGGRPALAARPRAALSCVGQCTEAKRGCRNGRHLKGACRLVAPRVSASRCEPGNTWDQPLSASRAGVPVAGACDFHDGDLSSAAVRPGVSLLGSKAEDYLWIWWSDLRGRTSLQEGGGSAGSRRRRALVTRTPRDACLFHLLMTLNGAPAT